MDPDCAAATDGQEHIPEHATVAVAVAGATPEASEYVPAKHLVQTEDPAHEYVPALQSMHVDDEFAPTADEYLPATPRHPHSQFTQNSSQCRRVSPHGTLLGCGRARSGGLGGLPAGHWEHSLPKYQFPTKPA